MTEESIFATAIGIPDPATREAYLDRACAGNVELRERLAALVAAHFAPHPDLAPPDSTVSSPDHAATADPDGTRDRPAAAGATGAVIAGRYKLLQRIGEGGMGEVWMADQTDPVKRRVAVKLIRAERGTSRQVLARFEAERQAIALMDHPHVAKLFDAGTTADGTPYFVMELVRGVPLTQFCDEHKLTVPDRLRLFAHICSAVQHAHQKGVIHRDLKPSNILVESHAGKPVPKVIDFGLAKAAGGTRLTDHTLFTGFGTVLGTPLYMAPEQATFDAVDVDTRTDVYALGVILYEMLTGTTPLTREAVKKAALDQVLKLVREQEAPSPSSRLSASESVPSVAANRQTEPAKLGRFVKGELDWIVLKALSKERDRRYESANGFAADVERFLNHEPVTAGPVGAGYRARKFIQRNRGPVIALGGVAAAVLLGFAGTAGGLIEARRQQGYAESNEKRANDNAAVAVSRQEDALRSAELARFREAEARRLASFVATSEGLRLADAGDLYGGLSWFVRAMDADPDNADLQAASRVRFATYERMASALHLVKVLRLEVGIRVNDLCFSPDGTQLAGITWSDDKGDVLRQWQASDGRSVGAPLECSPTRISSEIETVLSADQNRLFTYRPKGGIYVHDRHTGAALLSVSAEEVKKRQWEGATGFGHAPVLMPDGKRLLLFTEDTIQLWDVDHDRPVAKAVAVKLGFTKGTGAVHPSRDGRRVAMVLESADSKQFIRVLDGATLEPVGPDIPVKGFLLDSVSISGDGRSVAVAENDGRLGVWETDSGKEEWNTTISPLSKIGFSPQGDVLFAHGSTTRAGPVTADRLEFLDLRNKRTTLAEYLPGRNSGMPVRYRWSPDGRYLAIGPGRSSGGVRVVDSLTGKTVGPALPGSLCTFSPNGQQLVTAGADGLARIWEFRPQCQEVDVGDRFNPNSTTVVYGPTPDRAHVLSRSSVGQKQNLITVDMKSLRVAGGGMTTHASGISGDLWLNRLVVDGDNGPEVWDSRTGHKSHPEIPVTPTPLGGLFDLARNRVRNLAFVPPAGYKPGARPVGEENRFLIAETWDGYLHLCDAATGRLTSVPPVLSSRWDGDRVLRTAVVLSPDETRVVIFEGERTLRTWLVGDGQEVGPPFTCPLQPERFHFLDDRRVCVISRKSPSVPGGPDGALRVDVYDTTTGKSSFPSLALPANGNVILVNPTRQVAVKEHGPKPQMTLWDWTTGQQVGEPLSNIDFGFGIQRVTRALPDGRLIAVRGNRQLVTYDPTTAKVQALPLPDQSVSGFRLSADGRRLLHGSRLWDTSNWQPLTPPGLPTGPSQMSVDTEFHTVTGSGDSGYVVRRHDLRGTDRPVTELRALARLWSGRRFTDGGVLVEDTPEEWWEQYESVRSKYPAAIEPIDVRVRREWHLRQASDAMQFEHLRLPVAEWHLKELASSPLQNANERFQLGLLLDNSARFYSTGSMGVVRQPDLALARCRSAAEQFREVLRDDPGHTLARAWLASTSSSLAGFYAASRPDDATAAWSEARDALVQLHREFPTNGNFLQSLADARANSGMWFKDTSRPKVAEVELREALKLYRRLVAMEQWAITENPHYAIDSRTDRPKNPRPGPEHLDQIAWVASHLGIVYRDTARPKEAEETFVEAVDIRRSLATPHVGVAPVRRSYLAWTLAHAAKAARLRKDLAAARKMLDEADGHLRAILKEEPNNADFRQHDVFWFEELAYTMIESGEYSHLLPLVTERAKGGTSSVGREYGLACVFALCSREAEKDRALTAERRSALANECAVEAVKHLRSASDQGFRDLKWLRADPDFVSMRDRDDFKSVLTDLEKKLAQKAEK